MATEATELTRAQLRRIFKRHHGAMGALGFQLNITPQAISQWLRGFGKSQRIEDASQAMAKVLLKREANKNKDAA